MSAVRVRVSALVVVLAAVAAVCWGAAALAAEHRAHDRAVDAASAAAVAAVSRGLGAVSSYDYRHLDADLSRAESLLTRGFAAKYARTAQRLVRPLATKNHVRVTAQVTGASVAQAGANRVVVFAFLDQVTTSNVLTYPRVDRYRMDVTVVRSGGRWLIDAIDPV